MLWAIVPILCPLAHPWWCRGVRGPVALSSPLPNALGAFPAQLERTPPGRL